MKRILPKGLLTREWVWEHIHVKLYEKLASQLKDTGLQSEVIQLMREQDRQLKDLEKLLKIYQRPLPRLPTYYQFSRHPLSNLEELYRREFEIYHVYQAISLYFIPPHDQSQELLNQLSSSQYRQVVNIVHLMKQIEEQFPLQKSEGVTWIQKGYHAEKMIEGLTFPVSLTFDDRDNLYVAESGFYYGPKLAESKITRYSPDGTSTIIATNFRVPLTGITWHKGYIYAAEGGRMIGDSQGSGRILRISSRGEKEVLLNHLRTNGDHFTGSVLVGPDEKLYFTAGTATNSGVVGDDNKEWYQINPFFHDLPARNLVLTGINIQNTGVFQPFGRPTYPGQWVPGFLNANGVIYRCNLDGRNLEIVADGLRNPFGLGFSPDGKLFATDNGMDVRGSRPIPNDWDNLWRIEEKGWHGWPDFASGLPVTLPYFNHTPFLLGAHPPLATMPVARLASHSSSNKFDFSTHSTFGHEGELFIAQFGGGKSNLEDFPGYKVVRLHPETGQVRDFFVNLAPDRYHTGLLHPVEARFAKDGTALYIVDFGYTGRERPSEGTGQIWRITPH